MHYSVHFLQILVKKANTYKYKSWSCKQDQPLWAYTNRTQYKSSPPRLQIFDLYRICKECTYKALLCSCFAKALLKQTNLLTNICP